MRWHCPSCGRVIGLSDVRCRACQTKLVWWYINILILIITCLVAGMMILEGLSLQSIPILFIRRY